MEIARVIFEIFQDGGKKPLAAEEFPRAASSQNSINLINLDFGNGARKWILPRLDIRSGVGGYFGVGATPFSSTRWCKR